MEKKKFSRKDIEPQMIKICGDEYPAICSMAAIDEIENELGKPFTVIVDDLSAGGNGYTVKTVCAIVGACLRAGGTDVTNEDLCASVDFSSYVDLIAQIVEVIARGLPSNDEKPKNARKK